MGHNIQGFVAQEDGLRQESQKLERSQVVPLWLGYGFLPVTEHLCANEELVPFVQFERLSERLCTWAEGVSTIFPLVYIETDYFGGNGSQSAIAWISGKIVFGPHQTWDLWKDGKLISTPLLDGAINQAVRLMGVDRGFVRDEFDALGLGHHRDNESWLNGRG